MQTQMGTQLSEMVVTKFDGAMDPVYIADHVVFTIISSAKNTIYADSHQILNYQYGVKPYYWQPSRFPFCVENKRISVSGCWNIKRNGVFQVCEPLPFGLELYRHELVLPTWATVSNLGCVDFMVSSSIEFESYSSWLSSAEFCSPYASSVGSRAPSSMRELQYEGLLEPGKSCYQTRP